MEADLADTIYIVVT